MTQSEFITKMEDIEIRLRKEKQMHLEEMDQNELRYHEEQNRVREDFKKRKAELQREYAERMELLITERRALRVQWSDEQARTAAAMAQAMAHRAGVSEQTTVVSNQ